MSLRRSLLPEEQAEAEQQAQQEQVASKLREAVAWFGPTFSLPALQERLPFPFPSPLPAGEQDTFRACSWYTYPGWAALTAVKPLAVLSAFQVAFHLIDFTPLRAELVALAGLQLNRPGRTPYDPVSLFVCCLLRWEKGLGWQSLADFLAGPEGEYWRRLAGFADQTPCASTLRRFYHALGPAFDTDLCPRFIDLLEAAKLLGEQPPCSAGSAPADLPLAVDGMLHEAHASMRCGQVSDTCYQPTTPGEPRPCPARADGREGCDCTTAACASACRFTTPRDPQARLIHYSGRNQEEGDSRSARNVYGYRSYSQVLGIDPLHTYWVAHTSVQTATTDERTIFPADFARLGQRLPSIALAEVIADSALGYRECLDTVYDAGAIPVIVIRRDKTDEDLATCQWRGYDGNGHPLCAHGYPMSFNGLDYQRRRATWVCRQVCARSPQPKAEDADCPFRDPQRPLGQVRHVGRAFVHPDGSSHHRLARLYAYDSDLWRQHYASRKNMVEGRNSQQARLGLKRVWSYGLAGATADITLADLVINLRTLGRLVQEASLLVARQPANG